MYTAEVLPGGQEVGQANATSSESGKWRRRVASKERDKHRTPDAEERKLESQPLRRLNISHECVSCAISCADSAFPETFEGSARGPRMPHSCFFKPISAADCHISVEDVTYQQLIDKRSGPPQK